MHTIENPFIPQQKVRNMIIDGRISRNILSELKKIDISPVFTPCVQSLSKPVCGHPDMMLHFIKRDTVVAAPEVYAHFKENLALLNIKVIKGNSDLKSNYPEDIAYNVARINNLAFHNVKHTDKMIMKYYEQMNVKFVNVKQGYTKCSVCIINDHAIITSDLGIAKAADVNNIDVLLIKPGYISLPGLNYGFFGGATGLISPQTLLISGSLLQHPNYSDILGFCKKYNIKIANLCKTKIFDTGSLIPLSL